LSDGCPQRRQLAREDAECPCRQLGAVDRFWEDATRNSPWVEPIKDSDDDVLVTFLWKEVSDTQNVLLLWPVTATGRAEEYYLSHLDGTDVWYKTLRLRRGSTFTYTLSPNDRPVDRALTSQRDPMNPRRFPEEADPSDSNVKSVLELPGAPDETWFRKVPSNPRGVVAQKQLTSAFLKGSRDIFVYTPPTYTPTAGPYPLVIFFDGRAYIEPTWGLRALNTLDNLIADNRMRPAVVCFVDSSQHRATDLGGFEEAFGKAIAEKLLPMLRDSYAISSSPRDVVLGGYSSGGKTAALIALKRPDLFGNVLSQSGAFPQAPVLRNRTSVSAEPNALAQMYLTAPRAPVRLYLEYGLYERMSNAGRPLDELVLDEGITGANRHFRDVLIAKGYDVTSRETGTAHENLHWRATLADGLITLLTPIR
jgi:enterochelin esterase-like enzyme